MLWEKKNGSVPGILDESDFSEIIKSDAVFARKVSFAYSEKLLNFFKK
jgi:hypothetical protein